MRDRKEKIVIISPVRNEEEFIQKTIDSLLNQEGLIPVEWIVVDDGSTDRTADLVNNASRNNPWIRLIQKPDRGERAVGPGVVEAFYFGYDKIECRDYDYICKMDGDIEFKSRYFDTLLDYFEKDPQLGAASGKPFIYNKGKLVEERHNDEMVAGMINFYRRECFEQIGGFVNEVHWDGIAFHRARMSGWRTRSIRNHDLEFIHLRQMGSSFNGIFTGRLRWGRGQYFMGTPIWYVFAIAAYRSVEKPYILGGFFILIGYFRAMFSPMKRYQDKAFRKSLRAWQRSRCGLGTQLEKIKEAPKGLYP